MGGAQRLSMARKKKRRKPRVLPVVGWREWVALPELGVERMKVKVDSGARSSALHAYDVDVESRRDETWVNFRLQPLQRDSDYSVTARALLVDRRWVRSSSGSATLRPVIRTTIAIGGSSWPVEITLVRRDLMGFRMLLGRQAIRHRFLVDCGRSFLGGSVLSTESRAS